MPLPLAGTFFCRYGCFLKWWYPQNTPKWSFLVGKPMVVGYHHFGKPPYDNNLPGSECLVGHFSTLYTYYRYYWFNATTKNINTINTNADTKKNMPTRILTLYCTIPHMQKTTSGESCWAVLSFTPWSGVKVSSINIINWQFSGFLEWLK